MPLVMLIEDEPVLRSSMARGLARLSGVEVIDASLFGDAVRLLDAERPDLIVSDLDLPDGSGVEILAVLESRGMRVPVIFVTAYLGSFRGQLPSRPDVEVYEKPLPLARLREVVLRRLDMRAESGTDDSPFSLADYLQLACMGRHSVWLDVERAGESVGRITVFKGRIWSAECGARRGEDAVAYLAFAMPDASTRVQRLSGEPGPRTVTRPWQHILLDAARVQDEASRERAANPPDASLASPPRPGSRLKSIGKRRPPLPTPAASAERARAKSGRPSTSAPRAVRGPERERRKSLVAGPLPEALPPSVTGRAASSTSGPGLSPPRADDTPALVPDLPRAPPSPPSPLSGARRARKPSKAVERASAMPDPPVASIPSVTAPPVEPAPPAEPSPVIAPAVVPSAPPAIAPAAVPIEADDTLATPSDSVSVEDVGALMDRGLDAMLSRDYATAWRALSAANRAQPDNSNILANLARLRQLGFGDDR